MVSVEDLFASIKEACENAHFDEQEVYAFDREAEVKVMEALR